MIAGVSVSKEIQRSGLKHEEFRSQIEREVRYANITIIEGNNASQYGIGIVSARIAEAVLGDERIAIPIGSYHARFGVTLSLPSVIGRDGINQVLEPDLSGDESRELERSADMLRQSLAQM